MFSIKHVGFIGSRTFTSSDISQKLRKVIKTVFSHYNKPIFVSGGAKTGPDMVLKDFLRNSHYYFEIGPDFVMGEEKYKFLERDEYISVICNIVLAFCKNNSEGTMHTIKCCKKHRTPYILYTENNGVKSLDSFLTNNIKNGDTTLQNSKHLDMYYMIAEIMEVDISG